MALRPSEPDKNRASKDIAPQLDAANKKVDETTTRLRAATPATYDQLNAAHEAAVKQRDIVKKQFDEAVSRENKAVSTVSAKNKAASDASAALRAKGAETIRRRQESADMAKRAWQEDLTDKLKFDDYQKALGELSVKFDEYAAKGVVFPRTVEVDPAGGFREPVVVGDVDASVGAGTGNLPPTPLAGETQAQAQARVGAGKPSAVVPPAGTTGTGAGSPAKVLKSAVDKALKDQGLEDTPANRKTVRDGLANKTTVVDTAWENIFKTDNPGYTWMFTDEMKTKYPDVFKLFQESTLPGFDMAQLKRRLDQTSWFTAIKESNTGRELTAGVGSFSWGTGNLGRFLTTATHMGWTGGVLKQEAYKELFRKGGDGKYVNDLAIKEVQASTPYQKLKRIGTQFFAPMDDARVVESLTGGISSDDVLRLARERAKAMYPHLATQIDAGLTLDDLAYDYKRIAAETLELSPDQVDMSSAKFNKAMKSGEGGKERMMSTSEWEQLLRTDPQYGFSKTRQANRDATDIALAIARAFGKVG